MNEELIYDWNTATPPAIRAETRVLLNDETLRDGLQNPSVFDPSIEEKIEILHLMEDLGIDSVNIGLPGAGPRAVADTEALAREIATNRMKIKPNCAARTVEADILPIVEISQRVGIALEAATFLGSSPIRRLVEDWSVDHLERTTEKAVRFAVEHGLRGYDADRCGDGEAAVSLRDRQRGASHRAVRYRGARDAEWRVQPGEICD
jgi:2-isopropylmalate synthase